MRNWLRGHAGLMVGGLLAVTFLVWGLWPQPVLIEAAEVTRGPMRVLIEEEGRTRVIDRYVVAAPVSGVTCRVDLDVGDRVSAGEALLNITPLESQALDPRSRAQAQAQSAAADAALNATQAVLRQAQATAELAATELQRSEALLKQGMIPREQFDTANARAQSALAARRSAEFNVEVARYELESARSVLDYPAAEELNDSSRGIPVKSPINGRILKIERECEGPVQLGEPLLEIGDPTALEVEVDVLSADAVRIKPGMEVHFTRWGGEFPLRGAVRIVEPAGFTKVSALGVEEQRVLVISDITSPAEMWQDLGDGYRVEAQFILWASDDVLQVPASSLFRYNEGWAVFAIEGDRANRRVVEVGQRNGLTAEITQGLDQGERVINHPGRAIEDGVYVRGQALSR